MTTPKHRYIDELIDRINLSSGGPVSISLETAKRLRDLYTVSDSWDYFADRLDEEMPEPKP